MKDAVRAIEGALKALYHLDSRYRAEDFLVSEPMRTPSVHEAGFRGALYVRSESSPDVDADLAIGIYLSEPVTRELSSFPSWKHNRWSSAQMGAFAVAAEEISHFHYLVFHALRERQLTQLELELQAEVDKFLLVYFAHDLNEDLFEALFKQFFERFHWAADLSGEQRVRYRDASHYAGRFIRKCSRSLSRPDQRERAFRLLRRFYRLGVSEKVSFICA